MSTMNAILITAPGGSDVLQIAQVERPRPASGQILIRVAAAGVNRPDVLQRQGAYAPPPGTSEIPGLEVSGRVEQLGEGVARWRVGDAVCALLPGGGYAQYCVVHESNALPVPARLSMIEAAAIPETYFTVWTNVFDRGALREGETLLVHGGSSGIGVAAILLAKAFGARVVATVGSDEKAAACRDLGADVAINYRKQDFVAETLAATGKAGADVILDMVGGDYTPRNYAAAAVDGRIVQIAFLHGPKTDIDLRPLMTKRLVHTGSTLRPRSVEQKALIARALEEKVWPLLARGRCKPLIDSTYLLERAGAAQTRMETSAHIGKIVLDVMDA